MRSPIFIPNAGESLTVMTGVAEAHREFLRMVEVTATISERRTCLSSAEFGEWTGVVADMAESPRVCHLLTRPRLSTLFT